ncbi:MAG: hypothetical protein QNJ94_18650 [Alphaproteobacteria bacterium]|nr:hypothetical protein [Alphaproteobacteria bacterium]
MSASEGRKATYVHLPGEMIDWLRDKAKRDRRAIGATIEVIIEEWRDAFENTQDIPIPVPAAPANVRRGKGKA